MWEELNSKIKSIVKNIPEVIIKQGEIFDSCWLSR